MSATHCVANSGAVHGADMRRASLIIRSTMNDLFRTTHAPTRVAPSLRGAASDWLQRCVLFRVRTFFLLRSSDVERMEGDDEDDDRSSVSDCPVLLGFLSRVGSSASLLPHRFPSKVGGLPVWLERAHLPDAAALACRHTGRPLKFLLQVRSIDRRARCMRHV